MSVLCVHVFTRKKKREVGGKERGREGEREGEDTHKYSRKSIYISVLHWSVLCLSFKTTLLWEISHSQDDMRQYFQRIGHTHTQTHTHIMISTTDNYDQSSLYRSTAPSPYIILQSHTSGLKG